jgi:hypothetical protein
MQINQSSNDTSISQQLQSAADLLAQSTIYSANVSGKTYTASIDIAGGQYVATVPDLPAIQASGLTLVTAEDNLNARISLYA